jgi:hypothetical protein
MATINRWPHDIDGAHPDAAWKRFGDHVEALIDEQAADEWDRWGTVLRGPLVFALISIAIAGLAVVATLPIVVWLLLGRSVRHCATLLDRKLPDLRTALALAKRR